MSELAKMLTCVSTKRRVMDYPPISAVMDVKDDLNHAYSVAPEAIEYRVDVRLGSHVVASNPDELKHLIPHAKRRIVEHVFGEFRKPIMELRQSLYERDFHGADKLLGELYNQMFEEGTSHA